VEINEKDLLAMCMESGSCPALQDANNRLFLLEIVLHCADISNPVKSFKICERWARMVLEEFFQQGEREMDEGLEVSPMMDREKVNLNTMQINFIDFVVAPLYIGKHERMRCCFSSW
jgi:cAMP-specific phosphodiesterase 4